MAARFFVDENDLGLGRALGVRHEGVVYPGHADLPDVPRGTIDDDWLRFVGDLRLVVITRDGASGTGRSSRRCGWQTA